MAEAHLIPEGWPGRDVNVEVWTTIPSAPRRAGDRYFRARVTHRATGACAVVTHRDGSREALALALALARRRARAYEMLGLGDLAYDRAA